MTSLRRSTGVAEEMDRPDCDPILLRRTYAQFPLVNRAVAGWRGNYVRFIRPVLRRRPETRILDVGCGAGDIAINLARWALADGFSTKICGVDPDPRAIEYARQALRRAALPAGLVQFRETTSAQLAVAGEKFDVVLSNHLLHHLAQRELQQLQVDTEELCTGIGLHSDIRRARAALLLFGTATLPLARTSLIRRDGLVSIRRSYTTAELAYRARPGWEVQSQRTFRNMLLWKANRYG